MTECKKNMCLDMSQNEYKEFWTLLPKLFSGYNLEFVVSFKYIYFYPTFYFVFCFGVITVCNKGLLMALSLSITLRKLGGQLGYQRLKPGHQHIWQIPYTLHYFSIPILSLKKSIHSPFHKNTFSMFSSCIISLQLSIYFHPGCIFKKFLKIQYYEKTFTHFIFLVVAECIKK